MDNEKGKFFFIENPVDAKPVEENNGLVNAIKENKDIGALIENGADINYEYAGYYTPLKWAVYYDNVEAVLTLLNYAKKDDDSAKKISDRLSKTNFNKILNCYAKTEKEPIDRPLSTPLIMAISKEKPSARIVEALLQHVNINEIDGYGKKELDMAITHGNKEAVKTMLSRYSNVSKQWVGGELGIFEAARAVSFVTGKGVFGTFFNLLKAKFSGENSGVKEYIISKLSQAGSNHSDKKEVWIEMQKFNDREKELVKKSNILYNNSDNKKIEENIGTEKENKLENKFVN